MNPNLKEEKKLWKKGRRNVVGLDEVGRGALAGPVVAAAVTISKLKIFTRDKKNEELKIIFENVRDSKQLTAQKREELYGLMVKNPCIKWGIGRVSEKTIDKINIKNAAELAMEKALKNLEIKIGKAGFIIIDGKYLANQKLKARNHKLVIRGDEKIFSCAAASILAKVTRDRIMKRYHKKYPQYYFDRHNGYATARHLKALRKYRSCAIHRQSFRPVFFARRA